MLERKEEEHWHSIYRAADFTDLYVSVHGSGLCCSHQTLQLSTAEILSLYSQFLNVYVSRE